MEGYQNRRRRNERHRNKERKKKAHRDKCKKYMDERKNEANRILFQNLEKQIADDRTFDEIRCNIYLQKDRLMRDLRSQNLILNQCRIDSTDPFEYYHLSQFDIPEKVKPKSWVQWLTGY